MGGGAEPKSRPSRLAFHHRQCPHETETFVSKDSCLTEYYLHFPQVKAAIAAGKHVVCEKPLAMTSAESAELLRLATEAGIVHAVNFNIRFYPLCQHARALVQAGEIGAPRIIQGSYCIFKRHFRM